MTGSILVFYLFRLCCILGDGWYGRSERAAAV